MSNDDPTLMRNQPALQSSTGTVWLVVGAFFAAAALLPVVLIAFVSRGPSAPLAVLTGIAVLGLYLAMVVTRLVTKRGKLRLRLLATFFLALAAVALLGMLASLFIEQTFASV